MSEQKMNAGGRWLSALLLCFAVLNAGAAVAQAGKADKITPTIVAPPDPDDQSPDATPYNIQVPTTLFTGQTFTPTISFRNMGNPVWTGYPFRIGALYNNWGKSRLDFSGSVKFYDLLTLKPTLTAPSTPGTYPFAWQMVYEGSGFFGTATQVTMINVITANNNSVLNSVSAIPATMRPGETRQVSVTMTNTGNTTWTSADGYKLGFFGDQMTWGATRVELPASVAPNGTVTFNFNITAPSASGTYTALWKMIREGVAWFGAESVLYSIKVEVPQPPQISVSRTPSTMLAGQGFTLNWSTANATSLTRVCTAGGTGFNSNDNMALGGSWSGTANSAWVGYPSTCTWTATGPGGSVSAAENVVTTVPPGAPVVNVSHTPATLTANEIYTVTWSSSNATSVTMHCSDASYTVTLKPAGQFSAMAKPEWVSSPAVCTWTANGPAGSYTRQDTMTTQAAPAYCN